MQSSPSTPLLDSLNLPVDLRTLDIKQLEQLSSEMRQFLLYSVHQTGGHLGAGLGVVELAIALHNVFDTPKDKIVWDVGHQSYPHKILTGRLQQMYSMRQQGGLSPFPKREESEYDCFGVGHSSTSISAALGMALAADRRGEQTDTVAVIGDGALTAGMAFEAMNHAASMDTNLLVILNDNQMSISKNVGGMAEFFARLWASGGYNFIREGSKKMLSNLPRTKGILHKAEEYLKGIVSPAILFEELGFTYVGPIDGHNLKSLIQVLQDMRNIKGPRLLHIYTTKGKGYPPAEADPIGYHAVAKIDKKTISKPKMLKYQDVFGQWLIHAAEQDDNLLAITPAMCEGSGLVNFAKKFPDRYFDVAIAEQHAVTLAAGMACEGGKPVVSIYSTFLQRAYDQVIHDVAIQNLNVLFAVDRAGLVGEDGATHAGSFDLSFMRTVPNIVVMAPSDEQEMVRLLQTGFEYQGPALVRYPRGYAQGVEFSLPSKPIKLGKAKLCHKGKKIAILNFGVLLDRAMTVAQKHNYTLVDMRFIKPLDTECIQELINTHSALVTLEDNVISGGAGASVLEYLSSSKVPVYLLGLSDNFTPHASRDQQLAAEGLDVDGIEQAILKIKV